MTFDKKFIIKEIDSIEKGYLLRISSHYKTFIEDNPKTVLAKIYGLFSLKMNN